MNIGLDEAGRGSVLGDLVIGIVGCTPQQNQFLSGSGVRDSKKLSPSRREKLYDVIKKNSIVCDFLAISSKEIDDLRASGKTLNEIEVNGFRALCERHKLSIKNNTLYLDSVDVKPERFATRFADFKPSIIVSEHKADDRYTCVAAASIIAKVTRDKALKTLKYQVGSGYPSDAKTKSFLEKYYKEHNTFPDFVRQSWASCEIIKRNCNL
jgi:ribonuclease HII